MLIHRTFTSIGDRTMPKTEKKSVPNGTSSKEDKILEDLTKKLIAELGKRGRMRNQQIASLLFKGNKQAARGFLKKRVEEGAIIEATDESEITWYLSNAPDAYSSKRAHELLPEKERERILAVITDKSMPLWQIAHVLYGNESRGTNFLETFFAFYINLGLIQYKKRENSYSLTERGQELGLDAQSLKTLAAVALENEFFVKEEEAGNLPKSLKVVGDALKKDIEKKKVPVLDLRRQLAGKDTKMLFVGEVLYGSQYTDQELLEWILESVQEPSLVFASGLVQGRFEVRNKNKTRMLAEEGGMHKIESQFHSAGMLLEWLERITTAKVCVIQGDDDWRLAEDYGTLMHLSEGKNPWKFGVNWASYSAEMKRRLENKELRRKIRIQWEIIQTYMGRIGRSLLNRREVFDRIRVPKSEYRLIIEIMVAKRKGFAYPKEYEQIVNVVALEGNIGKRIVSPDPLRILIADKKEIRLLHNAGFSDITQYNQTIQHLDAVARHLGLSRQEMPWLLGDFHQESFFAEYLMGTWIMNLPGMQNTMPAAAFTMKEWNTKILESKERRQSRVRKEPASPSAPEMTLCKDGRIRFRILNNSIRRVIEEQKHEKPKSEILTVGTDFQFGSITEWPELVIKFLDYAFYHRRATRFYVNGDLIHGDIYPQHNAENRPTRLTTLHAQQKFAFELLTPLILDAPNLKDIGAWLGNHEWHNMSAKRSGDSPLTFLETGLQGVLMERRRLGTKSALERAMTVSRIRWENTHNPQGDIINWPFFADDICGFKVAIQHMWQPFAGRTPADEGKKWLKNMARAAKDIDILIGGDKHSVWMAELGDKLIVQAGAAAGQSGYELARGLMSTVMFTLVEFSNKEGITVEFVPWEFLMNYKLQSPSYRGMDEVLIRPKKGTVGYRQGKMSPFIETMIDGLTGYLPV